MIKNISADEFERMFAPSKLDQMRKDISDFLKSEMGYCELELSGWESAATARTTFLRVAQDHPQIAMRVINGRAFFINKDKIDSDLLKRIKYVNRKQISGSSPEELPPEEIRWRDMLGWDVVGEPFEKPENYDDSVDAALDALPERERAVLIKRYAEGLTLGEIGGNAGITKERVRQIQKKGLRDLRKAPNILYFTLGKAAVEKHEEEVRERMEALLRKRAEAAEEQQIPKKVNPARPLEEDISLNYLYKNCALSVRAHNCLRREGMETVNDVIAFMDGDPKKLLKIRSLGRGTAEEIMRILASLGVCYNVIEQTRHHE